MKQLLIAFLILPMISFGQKCVSGNCVNGQGTLSYSDGYKYEGGFNYGKFHGQGTYTSSDGTIIKKGLWKNYKFVGE